MFEKHKRSLFLIEFVKLIVLENGECKNYEFPKLPIYEMNFWPQVYVFAKNNPYYLAVRGYDSYIPGVPSYLIGRVKEKKFFASNLKNGWKLVGEKKWSDGREARIMEVKDFFYCVMSDYHSWWEYDREVEDQLELEARMFVDDEND